jgi:hypothetical protein
MREVFKMEYSVVVNNVEVVRVSGDEAAWNKFEMACELVRLMLADGGFGEAWAELREMNSEPIARFDEKGMSECGAVRGM